jgi:hypothetical protein
MRLSSVLADVDLSPVELQAARLDGEVYDLAGAYCLVGEVEGPAHRARAVLGGRSPRLIAELSTAAWIWGIGDAPERPEFAVTPDARARLGPTHRVAVREIVYEPGDIAVLDGCQVTTPLRTILDLARADISPDAVVVARLAAIGRVHLDDCLASLEQRGSIPMKARARTVLRELSYAVDTRYTS